MSGLQLAQIQGLHILYSAHLHQKCGQAETRAPIEKSAQDFSSDGEMVACDWLTVVSTGGCCLRSFTKYESKRFMLWGIRARMQ